MATRADFIIDQSSTFSTNIDLSQSDGTLLQLNSPGGALYAASGAIRKSYSTDIIQNFTCATSDQSPNQDKLTISLTGAQTKAVKAGVYVYDVNIVRNADSHTTRVLEGQVEFTPSVVNPPDSAIFSGIGVDYASSPNGGNFSVNDTPYRP